MRELSVRRAKRLRDIKLLIESLRENITLLGLKEAERTVRQHFESNHRVISIYTSVSEDHIHEITLSSKSYDVLKEMSTLLSSCVESRRSMLKSHFDCTSKIRKLLRRDSEDAAMRKHENDKMIGRLSDLSKELAEHCKDLVSFKSVVKKTLHDLYVESGKSDEHASNATELFWNENLSRSEMIANDQMNVWRNKFVCLMITEDETIKYGIYEAVWSGLFDREMRRRYLISKEYHESMLEVSCHLALLESCRVEEARLRTKIRSRQSILDQLHKVREMEIKMQEFETMASDSSRLLRGSSLARLEEERFRVRYAKLHPKRLASIAKEVQAWEKQNNEIFMLGGVSLADAVEKVRQKLLPLELSLRGAEILGIGKDDEKKKSIENDEKKKKTTRKSVVDDCDEKRKMSSRRSSKGKENERSSKIARPRTKTKSSKCRVERRTSGDGKKKKALKRSSCAAPSSGDVPQSSRTTRRSSGSSRSNGSSNSSVRSTRRR